MARVSSTKVFYLVTHDWPCVLLQAVCCSGAWAHKSAANVAIGAKRTCPGRGNDAFDAVDGARSAASECQRVVALKQTTLRGAVHGRG